MAVYTSVSDDDLETFLKAYDIGDPLSFAGIAEGVENSNFMVRTTTGTYILTLYEKRVDPDDLPFFLNLMNHLSAKGLSCPEPVRTRSGEMLASLNDRPAAVVTFLDGVWHRKVSPAHCYALGGELARMHDLGGDFSMVRENNLSVASWRPLLESCGPQSDGVKPGLYAFLEQEITFLEQNWPKDLPRGVVHADLFPDNVFFLGDKVSGFIDFYFACTDMLVYDLAICLNAWCFETDGSFNVTKARQMISSYDAVRKLSDAEMAALPVLARGSATRFLLTRLYDWINHPEGAFVKPKDPMEYHRKLSFHQSVTSSAGYGI
ncbi:homoserine kinase [Nisaea acidiphila]|uniref:Homoserine kinase n=1 Tax=Nisaea acidiphila TaxID=1862145 RepID=A0A9J7AMN6_9PROT|nr:homoserine kinase [Nisaea acidiphila]UUX48720.1 homoserine kinase [Nisaea acidiphila]